jgi:hypothetical protein
VLSDLPENHVFAHILCDIPPFHSTQMFNTALTRARHLSSRAKRIIFLLRPILIIYLHLLLGLPSGIYHFFEPSSCSSTLRNFRHSNNPKVHCCVHKSPSPVPVLSQMNRVHTLTSNIWDIHSNNIFPSGPTFPSGIFPWGLHTIPFPAMGFKPCNLTCLAWCTFLHVATGSHLPSSSSLLHGWIMLPALN